MNLEARSNGARELEMRFLFGLVVGLAAGYSLTSAFAQKRRVTVEIETVQPPQRPVSPPVPEPPAPTV